MQARGLLGPGPLAEDVADAVLFDLERAWLRGDPPRCPGAWIETVVRRRVADVLSGRRSEIRYLSPEDLEGLAEVAEPPSTPHARLEAWRRDLRAIELELLLSLSSSQARIYRALDGASTIREVARRAGVTPAHVRRTCRRIARIAREILRTKPPPPTTSRESGSPCPAVHRAANRGFRSRQIPSRRPFEEIAMRALYLTIILSWSLLAAAPSSLFPPTAGEGTFCIDDNPNGRDCEVIYSGSGTTSIEICITNNGCQEDDGASPIITVKFDCADGNPSDLQIAPGETKCATCKIKKVTVCDDDPCIVCGSYTTTLVY